MNVYLVLLTDCKYIELSSEWVGWSCFILIIRNHYSDVGGSTDLALVGGVVGGATAFIVVLCIVLIVTIIILKKKLSGNAQLT